MVDLPAAGIHPGPDLSGGETEGQGLRRLIMP